MPPPDPEGYYVSLFHGRTAPDETLSDWGFDGPIIGPFDYVQWTYGNLRFGTHHDGDIVLDTLVKDDLLAFDGKFYGDWGLLRSDELADVRGMRRRLSAFDFIRLCRAA